MMEHENIFSKKGRVDQMPNLRPGRPKQCGSYRQRFFAELDKLGVLEYLEADSKNRDKAIAYCYQKNATAGGKRFVVNTMKGGMVRIFREK